MPTVMKSKIDKLFWFMFASVLFLQQAEVVAFQNQAQQSLEKPGDSTAVVAGIITDNNGEPLYLAHVMIAGTTDGGVTNKTGRFRFSTRQLGPQTLRISMIGFQTIEKEIVLKEGQTSQVSVN